jgi:hypothetical protein
MADRQKGNVMHGARAIFYLDGKQVGYARSVEFGESITYEPLEVLGQLHDEEHVPVNYKVTFTAEMFRIYGQTVKSQGWFPKTNKDPKTHLLNVLNAQNLSATVLDLVNDRTVQRLTEVKIASHNWSIEKGTISGERVEFTAIRMYDESDG